MSPLKFNGLSFDQGIINLGIAENQLCEDLWEKKVLILPKHFETRS